MMNLPIWIPSKVTELVSAIFVSKARHRAHNAAAPVNQLPPEILAQIFEFASAEVRDTSMDWIALTHTCQYWRNAALGHPRLWSRFSFLRPQPWIRAGHARTVWRHADHGGTITGFRHKLDDTKKP
ncbi:hypothetical protein D9611_001280 [Ephemerocybe angulata]|uniref:F-box domain-containing protein n=1 Tax=Ephemerocybe angulata TaxID=980116 RepID=A0A8H5FN56_9AGAR|nr:hypothetical protein D9611_001280 [Tulosesus angulatus]